jgi:ABC-type Mn2+/Zn2+ transport system ATPase subunit
LRRACVQVSHCSLLFLDEPTSGLDSASSTEVATVLSRLAVLGITVIMVLHQVCPCVCVCSVCARLTTRACIDQPRARIFNALDSVLFMATGTGEPTEIHPEFAAEEDARGPFPGSDR